MDFRQLLNTVRYNGDEDQPPRTWDEIGELLSISRAHLFSLMTGRRSAPDHTVARIAKRLGRTRGEVQAAIDLSRSKPES